MRPLHGANEAAMELIEQFSTTEEAKSTVLKMLDNKENNDLKCGIVQRIQETPLLKSGKN